MSERTTLRRVPERGVADLDVIHAALDEELTAHVGLVAGRGATAERDVGHPVVSVAVGEPEPDDGSTGDPVSGHVAFWSRGPGQLNGRAPLATASGGEPD